LAGVIGLSALLVPGVAFAELELPRPSPNAKAVQTVGLTEITVDYSSPAVKGRKIWGGLVPYGEVWRAGANATTKVTFGREVTIGDKTVTAGSYAFFVIPQKGNWTIILNKDWQQGGAFNYKKELDVLRLDVKPQAIAHRERLAYVFADFSDNGGALTLEWEKMRVALPFKVGTEAQATASIKKTFDNAWQPYNQAARYLATVKNWDYGLELVDKSIAIKEDWQNLWTKASLLAGKGKYVDALQLAQKAKELGDKAGPDFFFAEDVKKALVEWKGKK
jgi:hypothetical protein